jgi:hypothetical protein
VEPQVLQQEDLSVLAVLDLLLDLGTDTVREESDGLGEEFGQLVGLCSKRKQTDERVVWEISEYQITYDRLQAVLLNLVTVRSSEVGHENDGSGTCNCEVSALVSFRV